MKNPSKKVKNRHQKVLFNFIEREFGVSKNQITGKNTSDKYCFIRMMSYNYLYYSKKYSQGDIAKVFNRSQPTINSGLSLSCIAIKHEKNNKIIDTFINSRLKLS